MPAKRKGDSPKREKSVLVNTDSSDDGGITYGLARVNLESETNEQEEEDVEASEEVEAKKPSIVHIRFAIFQNGTTGAGFVPTNAVAVYDASVETQLKLVDHHFAELRADAEKLNAFIEEVDVSGLSVQSIGLVGGLKRGFRNCKFPPPKNKEGLFKAKKLKSPAVSDSEARDRSFPDPPLVSLATTGCVATGCVASGRDSSDADESSDESSGDE